MAKAKATPARAPATIAEMGEEMFSITQKLNVPSDVDEHTARQLTDLLTHYEGRIFFTEAQSPVDALILLARIHSELDCFEADEGGPDLKQSYERLLRQIDRALYSVANWVMREHKLESRPPIVDYYMAVSRDPWDSVLAYLPKSEVG